MAETVAMAIHLLPKGKVIGERTWGATGPITKNELYNSGQFSIGGFLTVYMSSAKFKYVDNRIFESIGFTPDIFVPFQLQSLNSGTDLQLERAVQFLK